MSKTETRLGLRRIPTVLSESNAGPVQGMQVSSDAHPIWTFEHSFRTICLFFLERVFTKK